MIWKETENKQMPTIILLHGGGLSFWSLQGIIEQLEPEFHVVTPILDGHGEDGTQEFVSIEDVATKLIHYIEENYAGKVFAIGGLSIGAQIVTEVLSQRMNIAQYAIIESALVYPIKGITMITVPIYHLFYGLVKNRWFSKLQAKALCIPANQMEQYYQDSLKITKKSAKSLKEQIKESELYIVPHMKHGEISLSHPMEYTKLLKEFFQYK